MSDCVESRCHHGPSSAAAADDDDGDEGERSRSEAAGQSTEFLNEALQSPESKLLTPEQFYPQFEVSVILLNSN